MYDHIFDTRMINHIIRLAAWVLGWLGWLAAWAGWALLGLAGSGSAAGWLGWAAGWSGGDG